MSAGASEDSAASRLAPGLVVAGRYELLESIGAGGMGSVWAAKHLSLGHRVALKFLHSDRPMTPTLRTRFEREAQICAKLGEFSRHVVRVVDHGVLDDQAPFFVLEYLRGVPLNKRLDGPQPLQFAAEVTLQLGLALSAAHAAGIIHRDLKPGNVFLCQPEHGADLFVKLLDFGIAKVMRDDDGEHEPDLAEPTTRAGQILGTPSYMSPEQLSGDREIDERSDLWALAALVYRIVCGVPPFGYGDAAKVGLRVLALDPPAPSGLVPGLPVAFDAWVRKGLAKRREDRFASVGELTISLCTLASPALAARARAMSGDRPAVSVGGDRDDSPSFRSQDLAEFLASSSASPRRFSVSGETLAAGTAATGGPSGAGAPTSPSASPPRKRVSKGWIGLGVAAILLPALAFAWSRSREAPSPGAGAASANLGTIEPAARVASSTSSVSTPAVKATDAALVGAEPSSRATASANASARTPTRPTGTATTTSRAAPTTSAAPKPTSATTTAPTSSKGWGGAIDDPL